MYATEFQTIIDKPYIDVPQYDELKGKSVKVLFLVEDMKQDNQDDIKSNFDFIEYYTNNPVNLKANTIYLTRDEAHER